ncbi:hypothetical protein MTR_0014s0300 [Medicago truncatula]|uniref:Retrovirus-related Pol polyprotein from transposon TNT 1-94-like beta-barrel domain-containing protein n=1 Tax=Medicago truncatula TaxID=3880 RepID=A0A072TIT6_MEDTR|nr:hypothetical protein MTR_0014s0300 [Medicago truncatula]
MITWDDMEESDPQEDADTDMGLMAQSDFDEEVLPQGARTKPWYLDNGCSRHMTGDMSCFLTFEKKDGGLVTFGNNDKGKIRGKGTIDNPNSAKIENVQYVEGLKHNLLSISQLCDSGFEVVFKRNICENVPSFRMFIRMFMKSECSLECSSVQFVLKGQNVQPLDSESENHIRRI